MAVKKLSIKTKKDSAGKPKLVVHKDKPEEEVEEGDAHLQMDIEDADPEEEVLAEAPKKKKPKKAKVTEKPLTLAEVGQEVLGTVTVQESGQMHTDLTELVAVIKGMPQPTANVGFGMDRTINLGNYENVKVHVAIHVPSEVSEEEIEGNYEFAKGWCEQKMTEVLEEWVDTE